MLGRWARAKTKLHFAVVGRVHRTFCPLNWHQVTTCVMGDKWSVISVIILCTNSSGNINAKVCGCHYVTAYKKSLLFYNIPSLVFFATDMQWKWLIYFVAYDLLYSRYLIKIIWRERSDINIPLHSCVQKSFFLLLKIVVTIRQTHTAEYVYDGVSYILGFLQPVSANVTTITKNELVIRKQARMRKSEHDFSCSSACSRV